jgi:hypothetical protein
VNKLRINIMPDEDVVEHFKRRAARPDAAPYRKQIDQALREVIGKAPRESAPIAQMEEMTARIAAKGVDSEFSLDDQSHMQFYSLDPERRRFHLFQASVPHEAASSSLHA